MVRMVFSSEQRKSGRLEKKYARESMHVEPGESHSGALPESNPWKRKDPGHEKVEWFTKQSLV